ncbi:hypothetical protein I552_8205 [Mycobacterium xenopi 3993]|nr:hypothetical protein I552_8205 [Mycobacterium xenopi 3993]
MTNAVRDAVTSIAVDGIDHEPAPRIAPFADPGDPAAMLVPLTAAASTWSRSAPRWPAG